MSSRFSSSLGCGSPRAATCILLLLYFSAAHTVSLLRSPGSSSGKWLSLSVNLAYGFGLCIATYRLTLHPLAKYPGPWLAAITDWYNVYQCLTGDRHLELYNIHKKHGHVVRFGPNRISFNTNSALREIYGINSNNQKSQYYNSYKHFFKVPMSMTELDRKRHAFKRRVVNRALSKNVGESEELILRNVRTFCHMLVEDCPHKRGWSSAKNMTNLIGYLTSDIMGDVTFSRSWNMLRSKENRYILELLPQGVRGINTAGYMPLLLTLKLDQMLFPKLIRDVYKYEALAKNQSTWRLQQSNKTPKPNDFFSGLVAATDPETGLKLSLDEIISEAGLLIIAGSDTMATGITTTIFYLLHYPQCLLRCQNEIRQSFDNVEHIRVGAALTSCTYLRACLDEAMRLTPGVGGIFPRTTLDGGMVVDGEWFGPGVDLGVPHYAIHHNELYFPDPFVFKPERWFEDEETDAKQFMAANSAFCPFSLGRASCVGKTIAYQEMSITLARIIWLYDMRLAPGEPGTIGEGQTKGGTGRRLKNEFQVYDNFTSSHTGPMVQFKATPRA